MRRISLIFASLLCSILSINQVFAQPFAIGKSTPTFVDAARSNRNIPVEIYYPATSAGTNTPVATGVFPVMVIGHGFSMGVDAYYNFSNFYVPKGYIVVLVNTETGLSPTHSTFGADLNFSVNRMQALNTDASSIFFGKVKNKTALMGHSMGGGCSFIAAGTGNPNITTLLGFAPAETSTSAIAAAANITIPALMFYGNKDRVTPPADHVIPMYNALQSSCKNMVTITDGAHCRFANSNTACNFGEGTSCIACTFLTNAQQQALTFAIMEPWVNFYLKEQCDQWAVFETSLTSTTGTTHVRSCNYTPPIATIAALGATDICDGSSVDLEATPSTNNYVWSNGETTTTITVTQAGPYALSVSDQYCTTVSNTINVNVATATVAEIVSSSGASLCGGSSTLSLNNAFQTYLWSNNETTATITVTAGGNYQVTVTDANGCESIAANFNLLDAPSPNIAVFGNNVFCEGQTVNMGVDAAYTSYEWSTGETTQNIAVTQSNTYSVTVQDGNGCTATTNTNINFNAVPATPVIQQKEDSLFIAGSGTIEWYYNNNLVSSGTNIIKATQEGQYTVVITDANGCTATSQPFDFISTSIFALQGNRFLRVYPNPAESIVNISAENLQQISAYDISGKIVYTEKVEGNSKQLNVSSLTSGNYILSIQAKNEVTKVRLVKF
jgi:alpha-beta hydrolase superfamily lysophospholipase